MGQSTDGAYATSTVCVDGKDAHTVNTCDICNYNCEGLLLLRCIEYPTLEDHISMIMQVHALIESHVCKQ